MQFSWGVKQDDCKVGVYSIFRGRKKGQKSNVMGEFAF